MKKGVGFVRMAEVRRRVGRVPEIGVGMLGYAFMGKAHSQAYIDLELNVGNYVVHNMPSEALAR